MKPHRNDRPSGMTLVMTLFIIVLLASLLVAFITQARYSRQSSALQMDATSSRQLGENAAQLVMMRIRQATLTAPGEAWASQPGALWVYGANGLPARMMRLYSAPEELATTAAALQADLPLGGEDWQALPHQWVDLNRPWNRAEEMIFPIVDPRLVAAGADAPEGFSYTAGVPGVVRLGDAEAADNLRLPMPVQWLYQLSNGDLVAPTSVDAAGVVTLPVPDGVEVIGRVAFWTDDETTKLNLNTAAGGAFWDTPRIHSQVDHALAMFQPVQGEFQRYPGHPATTDLRAVFPWLSDAALYDLVPRLRAGGSENGTVETSATSKPAPIVPDTDPLHVTPAEARYQPDRSLFATMPAFGPAFSKRLAQGEFLLTTSSRSPELNLFGHPRLSIWPTAKVASDRSPLDRLLAMAASLRREGEVFPFYFQREEALDPRHDFEEIARNQQLLAYLRAATSQPVPGFGGDFETKYGGPVRDQILTEIFDYIRGATNLKDPVGKRFADPIPFTGSGSYQLDLGEGQVTPIRIDDWGTQGFGRFFTVSEAFLWLTWQGEGANSQNPNSVAQPATAPAFPLPANPPPPDHTQVQAVFALQFAGAASGYSEMTPDLTVRIEGLDQLHLNGAPMGFPADGSVHLSTIGQVPMGGIYDLRGMVRDKRFSRDPSDPARFPFYSDIVSIPNRIVTGTTITTPLSRITSIDAHGGELPATPIKISIYSGPEIRPDRLVQTIEMELPLAAFRPPLQPVTIAPENKHNNMETPIRWGTGTTDSSGNPRPDRFVANAYGPGGYIDRNDVTRSMVSTTGDHRLTAALRNVPASFFQPHRGPSGSDMNAWRGTANNVSSLLQNLGYSVYARNVVGKLHVDRPNYTGDDSRPQIASHIQGKPSSATSWDFDTGIATSSNGAFINKPDEGSLGSNAKRPYFGGEETAKIQLDETMFTPNRQLPSAAMFGSLPSGINPQQPDRSIPWQTLHFRPDPVAHPGNTAPRDHLLLDLFWMPVVEPYALSEPFSTAGKVNLNTRIAPFHYIRRDTALHAALRHERLLALRPADAPADKHRSQPSRTPRLSLDIAETLAGVHARFEAGGLFLSPTEICTLYLVPEGHTLATMPDFWQAHDYTGDNVRERPYANLLPKLTTRSNTYSVHVMAQALRKRASNARNRFGDPGDQVVSEWAGTYLIERFLDPNDSRLFDVASYPFDTDDGAIWNDPDFSLHRLYQMRVLQVREWR